MLAEGLTLTLALSRRESELGCGYAVSEPLFSTSAFFAQMLAEGLTLTLALSQRERELGCGCAALG